MDLINIAQKFNSKRIHVEYQPKTGLDFKLQCPTPGSKIIRVKAKFNQSLLPVKIGSCQANIIHVLMLIILKAAYSDLSHQNVKKLILIFNSLLVCLMLSGCLGYPDNLKPVNEFAIERYLGKWYEIARLDHSFERNLSRVTADYRLRSDGGIDVINTGYQAQDDEWKQAKGRAYFVEGGKTGYLKVSFFGPFYGSYVIFELDKDEYQYAYIAGPNKSYLWYLSRTSTVTDEQLQSFYQKADTLGFNTNEIIVVEHD